MRPRLDDELIYKAALPFFAKYGFEDDGETNGLHAMHILGENVQLSHCGGNCATCHSRSEECIPKALR